MIHLKKFNETFKVGSIREINSFKVNNIKVEVLENSRTFALNDSMIQILYKEVSRCLSKMSKYINENEINSVTIHLKGNPLVEAFMIIFHLIGFEEDIRDVFSDNLEKLFDKEDDAGNLVFSQFTNSPNRYNTSDITIWSYMFRYEMDVFNGPIRVKYFVDN